MMDGGNGFAFHRIDGDAAALTLAPPPADPSSAVAPDRFEPDAPSLSIVAPCYNEQDCVLEFHRRATACALGAAGDSYEIVLVNDGSRDNTWTLMRGLAAQDPHVVAVNLSRNFGHQKALSAGLHVCRGDRVLVIDADLQDPPELLPDMMRRMDEGYDVVFGQRRRRDGESTFKTASAAAFYRLLRRLTDIDIPSDTGDFRLMTRRTVDIFKTMPEQFRFIRGLISWIGLHQTPIVYDRKPRHGGQSGYPLRKMIAFATDAITSFSVIPLRIVTYIGLLASLASALVFGYAVVQWLRGATITGWTSLACMILAIGGLQFLFLGVLGEYVGRIYIEGKRRPLFIIDSIYRVPVAGARR
jgi:glycosyltransferase involved in cell wall biosynthesis